MSLPAKGTVVSEKQLNELVHAVQLQALAIGQIPIAGVVSRKVKGGHEVLGAGHNLLRSGLPGIHGETGALISTGNLPGGYDGGGGGGVTITSSLNPCNFCQRVMCCHLGIKHVRILDSDNLAVEPEGYAAAGVKPVRVKGAVGGKVGRTFAAWVNDPANRHIWNRDIGIFDVPTAPPWDPAADPRRLKDVLALAHDLAERANTARASLPPVAALVLDAQGEVIGSGHSRISLDDDPTATPAMVAWRAAGARDHWKDKTLVLTCGPDHIAYAMFTVFNFGRLVIASDKVVSAQLASLRRRLPGLPVTVVSGGGGAASDARLKAYLKAAPSDMLRREFGADFPG